MGLSFESLIGTVDGSGRRRSAVSPEYLGKLVRIGNERFVENGKRIARFLEALRLEVVPGETVGGAQDGRSEKGVRRERKMAEGLRRQAEARSRRGQKPAEEVEAYIDGLAEDTNLS